MKRFGKQLCLWLLVLAMVVSVMPMILAANGLEELSLPNGDFESGDATGWELTDYSEVKNDAYAANNTTYMLNLWLSDSATATGAASYTVSLAAGTYQFTFDISGADSDSGLGYAVTAGDKPLFQSSGTISTKGWDVWTTYETAEFTLEETANVTFTLSGSQPAGYWGWLDNLKLYGTGSIANGNSSSVPNVDDLSIAIPYVPGTDNDFIRGVDVSSLLSILNSGAHYYDFDGNMLGEAGDVNSQGEAFMQLLADSGVNWVRFRVWNDPFDEEDNGYGGGNNDINAAVTMGQWATKAGLRVLIDFHYSDFWADPGKQKAPKAWANMDLDQKADALSAYTTDCLTKLKDAGVDVGMVQIGNETTGGIAGVTGTANMCKLFNAGSAAVRAVDSSILVAIHITNPEKGNITTWAKNLYTNHVNYDVLASSYYPYWHGTKENLTSQIKTAVDTYGIKVIVAETSWAYTLEDGDGHTNSIINDYSDYATSVQGQASEVAGVAQAVVDGGGSGLFYWEPAWIPVVNVSELTGEAKTAQVEKNNHLWEEFGSGWASSYAAEYDPDDAGVWYGGSAWDNQAMFDFDGHPLDSLLVWKYMQEYTGEAELKIIDVTAPALTYYAGDTLSLPATIQVSYNTGNSGTAAVTWNNADVANADMNTPGVYEVRGVIDGYEDGVTCTVTVLGANLLSNPGFEESDMSMYAITQASTARTTEDPHSGSYSLHFYNSSAVDFTASQTVTLTPGEYTFSLYGQGGDMGTDPETYIYVTIGDTTLTQDFSLTGWNSWTNPQISFTVEEAMDITVGVNVTAAAGAWGTFDDFYLALVEPFTGHEHDYEAPVWTWTETGDGYAVTAAFTCKDGDDTQTVHATVTSETTNAICEEDGEVRYTATVEFEGKTYTDVKTDVIPALGHDYQLINEKQPTLFEDGYSGDLVCSRCGDIKEKGHVIPATGSAILPVVPSVPSTVAKPTTPMDFTDVTTSSSFYDAVKYVYDEGLMNGTSDTKFSPNSTLTRAMVVTILYRMEGEPANRFIGRFADVPNYEWYTSAVEWAAKNDIVTGYTATKFGPNDPVTREQLAAILYRYAQYKGYDISKVADLSGYTDGVNVSEYAKTNVAWAAANGILESENGKLRPRDNAIRAEVAVAVAAFHQQYAK